MMNNTASTPWHQYAIISYLAQKLGGRFTLGKTAVQKLIYLIQELGKVPIGYRFHFYHYGPYSSDLAGDLDYVGSLKGISIQYDPTLNMYDISQGENAEPLISKASNFVQDHRKEVDRIIYDFGGKRAQELELIATIVYVRKDAQLTKNCDETYVVKQVSELKPKFDTNDIQTALNDLIVRMYLEKIA